MILEQALLQIRPGEECDFEAAFASARPLIAASVGFQGLEIYRAAEKDGLYLLLVRWNSVSDHRDGFRGSDRYKKWRALLHRFYDPMPTVDYFGEAIIS